MSDYDDQKCNNDHLTYYDNDKFHHDDLKHQEYDNDERKHD